MNNNYTPTQFEYSAFQLKKPLDTSFFDNQIRPNEYSVRLANGKKIMSFSDPGSLSFI